MIKNSLFRKSKQHMVEKKMFGNKIGKHGKDFQIGKKFRKVGKGIMKSPGDMKSGDISPSVEEFDDMLNSSVTHNPNKKKSLFSRKSFG
jgi:hypothetical protein